MTRMAISDRQYSISNPNVTATVSSLGSELIGLRGKSGIEYMWRADPNVWGRSAPILFPVVGMLSGNCYKYGDKTYTLESHGFVRDMNFELAQKGDSGLTFRLEPTSHTRLAYPFEFVLDVSFQLEEECLSVEYKVINGGETEMPFSIGAHPAFSLEWGVGDQIEDYFLEFEKKETIDTRHLDENKLLSNETERVLTNENILPLKKDMFIRDALILLDIESTKVSLASHNHSNRVTVEFPGFPYLGIWAKPSAPYVCIEPWHGYVDPADTDGVLLKKPGIIKLAPNDTFTCVHRILINE